MFLFHTVSTIDQAFVTPEERVPLHTRFWSAMDTIVAEYTGDHRVSNLMVQVTANKAAREKMDKKIQQQRLLEKSSSGGGGGSGVDGEMDMSSLFTM